MDEFWNLGEPFKITYTEVKEKSGEDTNTFLFFLDILEKKGLLISKLETNPKLNTTHKVWYPRQGETPNNLPKIQRRLRDGLPTRFRRNVKSLEIEEAVECVIEELKDVASDLDDIYGVSNSDGGRGKMEINIDNINVLQKYIIMLLAADDSKPIPSFEHLEHMIFLCAKNDPELQEFLDRHSSKQNTPPDSLENNSEESVKE